MIGEWQRRRNSKDGRTERQFGLLSDFASLSESYNNNKDNKNDNNTHFQNKGTETWQS
jgi:hypothetical protein